MKLFSNISACVCLCGRAICMFGSLEGQPRNWSTSFKFDFSYSKLALTACNIIFGFALFDRYFCAADINKCACACLFVCVADLYVFDSLEW